MNITNEKGKQEYVPETLIGSISLTVLWGIINACLIAYGVFERPRHHPAIGFAIVGELFGWIVVGVIAGAALQTLVEILKTIPLRRFLCQLADFWNEERYYSELDRALSTLDTALQQKDEAEVKAHIGQARECVLRALGGNH